MNLDDMKSAWQDNTDEAPEVCLEQQKSLRQPVDIICKNMKKEMLMQLFGMVFIFLIIVFTIKNPKFLFYAIAIFSVALSVTAYYAIRFKELYASIQKAQHTSYQSLLELNYSLKYFKDLYISYNLSFVPFILCGYILWVELIQGSIILVDGNIPIFLVLSFIVFVVWMLFVIKFTFDTHYGKYIFNIAQLLKTIEQPYDDFDKSIIHASNGNYLYTQTENFCIKKMGAFGEKVNFIIWQGFLFASIIMIGFLMG